MRGNHYLIYGGVFTKALCSALAVVIAIAAISVEGCLAQQKGKKDVTEELNKLVSDIDKKNSKNDPVVGDQEVRVFLDKIEILGQIDRPQAVYVVLGSDPRIDDIGLDRSFFKEIFRPVDRLSVRRSVSRQSRDYIPW